jgi:hypothetical protein
LLVACLVMAGVVRATLPADEFSVEWRHSIEHTRWREDYAIRDGRFALERARIEGMGAGMDTGEGAVFDGSGWTWKPAIAPLAEIRLTLSPYTADYRLCAAGRCRSLHEWIGQSARTTAVVTLRPCQAPHSH